MIPHGFKTRENAHRTLELNEAFVIGRQSNGAPSCITDAMQKEQVEECEVAPDRSINGSVRQGYRWRWLKEHVQPGDVGAEHERISAYR
jgi:hypothetical protein